MRPHVLIHSKDPDFFLIFEHILVAAGFETRLLSGDLKPQRDVGAVLAVIVDCQPGDQEVAELCASLKAGANDIAVAGVVAPGAGDLHLDLVRAGMDEIFLRPFPPAKLVAWVNGRTTTARTSLIKDDGDLIHGDFMLERRSHRAVFNGRKIALPPIEFNLLRCLMSDPGTVISRENLIRAAWPEHASDVEIRGVDVHVARLRKKLKTAIGHDVIRAVRSVGYAFAPHW